MRREVGEKERGKSGWGRNTWCGEGTEGVTKHAGLGGLLLGVHRI